MRHDAKDSKPAKATSVQVLIRIVLRLIIIASLAGFGGPGFVILVAPLLMLAAFYCSVVGAVRREAFFGPALSHWDEAAGYFVMGWTAEFFS